MGFANFLAWTDWVVHFLSNEEHNLCLARWGKVVVLLVGTPCEIVQNNRKNVLRNGCWEDE
jgi:hypothetical protein